MIQEIIVYIIGIAVAMLLVSKIYKAVFGKKQNKAFGCSNCSYSTASYKATTNRVRN